ncbi:MAG: pyridoxamine kinase [Lentisphaeria bacterium]|nr:pyridoxamine kinase [Lentisphaeria bacterium]
MKLKRVLTVQDVSCIGKCSATVAVPIISLLGSECAVLPTAVLSTHTMFKGFTFRDLTPDIPGILAHWKKEKFEFDAIYTGYLGSFEQLDLVSGLIDDFRTSRTTVIIDPVMADNGKLYPGFTPEFAVAMGKLCGKADIIVPNLTEAAFMLAEPCRLSGYDEAWIKGLLRRLAALGAKKAVLTGVSFEPGKLGVMGYDSEKNEYFSYFHRRLDASFHGTGDLFASTMTGAYLQGRSLLEALTIAADFTAKSMEITLEDPDHAIYAVQFERAIPWLVKRLEA